MKELAGDAAANGDSSGYGECGTWDRNPALPLVLQAKVCMHRSVRMDGEGAELYPLMHERHRDAYTEKHPRMKMPSERSRMTSARGATGDPRLTNNYLATHHLTSP